MLAAGRRPTLSFDYVPSVGGDSAAWTAASAPVTRWSSPPSTAPTPWASPPAPAAARPARAPT
ncbi:hypothetical protein [Streptomyces sp. 900105755]